MIALLLPAIGRWRSEEGEVVHDELADGSEKALTGLWTVCGLPIIRGWHPENRIPNLSELCQRCARVRRARESRE